MTAPDRFFVELRTALLRIRVERSYWRNLCRDRDAETRRLAARCERLRAELAEAEATIARVDDAAHEHFVAIGVELPYGSHLGEAARSLPAEVARMREQIARHTISGVTFCVPRTGGGGRFVAVDRAIDERRCSHDWKPDVNLTADGWEPDGDFTCTRCEAVGSLCEECGGGGRLEQDEHGPRRMCETCDGNGIVPVDEAGEPG